MPMPSTPYVGKVFTLTPDIVQLASDAFDDMLFQLGKPCQLFYPSNDTICPNCIINPKNGLSTGRYKVGGPIPFAIGTTCPVCEGKGMIAGTADSYTTTFQLDWEIKPWMNLWASGQSNGDKLARTPGSFVTIKGFVEDIIRVSRCDYAVMDINANYTGNKFRLLTEPITAGSIPKNRYFECTWVRVV